MRLLLRPYYPSFPKSEFEIKISLEGNFYSFNEYREVFSFFSTFDRIYLKYLPYNVKNNELYIKEESSTRVLSVAKGSLDIVVFIEDHWLEFLLIILASYKDIKSNVKEIYYDSDNLISKIEQTIKEVTVDFPSFEINIFIEYLKWLKSLNDEQLIYLTYHIKRGRKVLDKVKKITIRKN